MYFISVRVAEGNQDIEDYLCWFFIQFYSEAFSENN